MNELPGDLERSYPDGRTLAEQPQWQRDFPTDVAIDNSLARREFTRFLVLTSGAFVAGQCWIIGMSLFQGEESFPAQRIADDAAVLPGSAIEFRYPTPDDPCLLLRLDDGRLVAYGQKCSHLACAVIPDLKHGQLTCPCHNGHFELSQGRPIAGPPRRPLPLVKLVVDNGGVYATGVEYRTA